MPQVSREELRKFYESMKSDDTRRQKLRNLDNEDDLMAELRRMWVMERYRERGPGGPGGPGGRGGGPPGGRNDGRDRTRSRRQAAARLAAPGGTGILQC